MSRYKLGRLGTNLVLIDYNTGISKVFSSSGKYIQDGFNGLPTLSDVKIISLVQVGQEGVAFDGEREVSVSPMKSLASLSSTPTAVYPLQLSGRLQSGKLYKQFIFCYPLNVDVSSIYTSL